MQPLQEGTKNPVKARKVRSDKGVPRGSRFGPDVYPEPLLSDAVGTRQKKNPSGGGYQSDDDRSVRGQQNLMDMLSPAVTRSRSAALS
jgi:hypothetical protein